MWFDVYSNNFSRTSFDFSFVDKGIERETLWSQKQSLQMRDLSLICIDWKLLSEKRLRVLINSLIPPALTCKSLWWYYWFKSFFFFDSQRNFFFSFSCVMCLKIFMNELSLLAATAAATWEICFFTYFTLALCSKSKMEWVR